MSRVFEALRQFELEARETVAAPKTPILPTDLLPKDKTVEPGLDKVATVAINPPAPRASLLALTDEQGLGAEKFRVLATRLSHIREDIGLKTVQLTSSVGGEGKTMVAANLALTLAKRSDKRVLLIEGDTRKPGLCPLLGVSPKPGLGEWWGENASSVLPYLRRFRDMNVWFLSAGLVTHPTPILQSARLAEMMTQLAEWFDWIVIDTPPLLPMADSNLWAKLVDGTLLVVREGTVSHKALKRAVESLDDPTLVGVVLNDASNYDEKDYYGKYGYGRSRTEEAEASGEDQG